MAKSTEKSQDKSASLAAPKKMQLLFTVVNREKTDFYVDFLQNFEINMQMILSGSGTAGTKTLQLLGLASSEKSVILSVIKRERAEEALAALEEKFRTVRGGKGIAYTVPMTSTVGVAIYQFLSHTVG